MTLELLEVRKICIISSVLTHRLWPRKDSHYLFHTFSNHAFQQLFTFHLMVIIFSK